MENFIKLIGDDCWDIILDYVAQLEAKERMDKVLEEMRMRYRIECSRYVMWGTTNITDKVSGRYRRYERETYTYLNKKRVYLAVYSFYDNDEDDYRSSYKYS